MPVKPFPKANKHQARGQWTVDPEGLSDTPSEPEKIVQLDRESPVDERQGQGFGSSLFVADDKQFAPGMGDEVSPDVRPEAPGQTVVLKIGGGGQARRGCPAQPQIGRASCR